MSVTGTLLGTSRTAQVFALSDHEILKLYPAGCEAAAEREAQVARVVQAMGVPCPLVLGRTESEGRSGIIYARLQGPSLQRWLGLLRPWRIPFAGKMLAQVHATLHAYHTPTLPPLRDMLERDIRAAAPLSPRTRSLALRALEALPDGDTLCHGDLTPDNILLTAEGPIVIDWPDAARGDPAADVALTLLHLAVAYTYYRPVRRPMAWATFRALSAAYRHHDRLTRPEIATRAESWLLPVMAARLSRGAPVPRHVLLGLIDRLQTRVAAP